MEGRGRQRHLRVVEHFMDGARCLPLFWVQTRKMLSKLASVNRLLTRMPQPGAADTQEL